MLPIRVVLFALSLVFTVSAYAVTMSPPLPPPNESFRFDESTAFTDIELKNIVALLKEGKRQEANLRIAKILAKQPSNKEALELAGISLMQSNKFVAAEESFRRLVSLPPVKPSVITNYGITKILNNKVANGVKLLEQVLQYTPNDPLALRYLAWAAENNGQPLIAIGYLEKLPTPSQAGLQEYHVVLAKNYDAVSAHTKAIKLLEPVTKKLASPSNLIESQASLYLSLSYAAEQQINKAKQLAAALRKYIANDPGKLFLLNIRLASASKDFDTAKQLVNKHIAEFPAGEAFARYELARAYLGNKDIVAAFEQLDLVLAQVDEGRVVNLLGTIVPILLKENMYSYAVDMLKKQSDKYPNNDIIKYNLAESQALSGRKTEAYKTVTSLLERDEPFLPGYLLAGGIARKQGRYNDAINHLETATKQQPSNIEGWISLAGVHYDQRREQQSIDTLKAGINANQANAKLNFELGSLYQFSGRINKANDAFRRAIAIDNNHIAAKDNLASNLLDMNQDLQHAKSLAKSVYQQLPEDPYIQDLWGWALYRTGEFENALPHLQQAANEVTASGRADYHLALTLEKLNQTNNAAKHYKIALKKGIEPSQQRQVKKKLINLTQ